MNNNKCPKDCNGYPDNCPNCHPEKQESVIAALGQDKLIGITKKSMEDQKKIIERPKCGPTCFSVDCKVCRKPQTKQDRGGCEKPGCKTCGGEKMIRDTFSNEYGHYELSPCPDCVCQNCSGIGKIDTVVQMPCPDCQPQTQAEAGWWDGRIDGMDLAVWLHLQYEDEAMRQGWKTQEKCRVAFNDLPIENKATMLSVANALERKFRVLLTAKDAEVTKRLTEDRLEKLGFYDLVKIAKLMLGKKYSPHNF